MKKIKISDEISVGYKIYGDDDYRIGLIDSHHNETAYIARNELGKLIKALQKIQKVFKEKRK